MRTLPVRVLAILLILSACTQPGQSQYGYADVGHVTTVEFGVVDDVRPVDITGKNTGTGAAAGVGTGALAGSAFGQGSGTLGTMLIGAVVGGIAGHMAEQAIQDHKGFEYVIDLDMGKTITIVQNIKKEDVPLPAGARCMVQTSGQYQRVLPSQKPLPEEKPKHKKRHHKHDDDDEDGQ